MARRRDGPWAGRRGALLAGGVSQHYENAVTAVTSVTSENIDASEKPFSEESSSKPGRLAPRRDLPSNHYENERSSIAALPSALNCHPRAGVSARRGNDAATPVELAMRRR